MTRDPLFDRTLAEDPTTAPAILEEIYWWYFTQQSGVLHPICEWIAQNPNLSMHMMARVSLHTPKVAHNPALPLLWLERPDWMRRHINPTILREVTHAKTK